MQMGSGMERVCVSGRLGTDTRATGRMINLMEKVCFHGQMGISILALFSWGAKRVLECVLLEMRTETPTHALWVFTTPTEAVMGGVCVAMKAIIATTSDTAEAYLSVQMVLDMKESGCVMPDVGMAR